MPKIFQKTLHTVFECSIFTHYYVYENISTSEISQVMVHVFHLFPFSFHYNCITHSFLQCCSIWILIQYHCPIIYCESVLCNSNHQLLYTPLWYHISNLNQNYTQQPANWYTIDNDSFVQENNSEKTKKERTKTRQQLSS